MRAHRPIAPTALAATLAAVLVAGAGCKIDSTVYQPPGGDGDAAVDADPSDGGPDGIHVQVNPSTTTVSEGGQTTVRVRLSEAPPAERTITVVGTPLLTPTPATLTFTPDNWNVERTVILAAGQDDDADDSPVTVLFDGGGQVADGVAMVMITDDDQQLLIVTPPSSVGVTEGATAAVSVRLNARPASAFVVSVVTMNPAIATATPAQLTFTSGDWATPQTVTVTGVQDPDTADASTLLVLDPVPEGVPTHALAVNVTDDDVLAIDATPSNLGTITEAAGAMHSASFAVRLTQAPPGDVVVDLQATPAAAVTLSAASLTFTTANYATPQQVTVTARDDLNVVHEQVSILLSSPDGPADRFVQVAIQDDDVQVIQVSPTSVPTLLEGTSTDLSVRLAFEPAGTVIVDVASGNPSLVTVNQSQLTFTPATYATPQVVRVTAVHDVDLVGGTTPVSFNAAAQGLTTTRTINVMDDDVQALEVTPATIAVNEGGTTTYSVRLVFQPATDVVVANTVAPANAEDISASPTSLTFTPSSYATPRTVTVTGLQDADVLNETATVVVSSTGVTSRNVTVNVTDDDSVDIVTSPATITVTEGQGTTLMVSLGAMPASDVVVSLQDSPDGVVTLGASSLTFTRQNYATPQPVVVSGDQDPDGANDATTIFLTAPGLATKTVPVTVIDDDTVVPVLAPTQLTVEEGTPDGSVRLTLSRDPGRAVTVEVLAGGFTDFSVSPLLYQFAAGQWNVAQTVTVLAHADDTQDDEVETATFRLQGETGQATLTVNTLDPTVLLGFPPPHGATGVALTGLEAYRDGSLPQCYRIEKLVVDVTAAPVTDPRIQVGLYTESAGQPASLLWSSGSQSLGTGTGVKTIDVVDHQLLLPSDNQPTWVAVETTSLVTLRQKQVTVNRCVRAHTFGDFLPNPFNASGYGGGIDPGGGSGSGPGSGADAGTDAGVIVTCASSSPVAVWIIGQRTSCGALPPPL